MMIKPYIHPRLRHWAGLMLALCCAVSLSAAAHASRVGHGTSLYPIWSDLSYFEQRALAQLGQARNGDPDALLALYLVSSGVRDSADYETVRRRVDEFLAHAEKHIIEDDNSRLVGQILNSQMHRFFFLQESRNGAPNGYAEDQSRLMGIFETGEFNCISASLLYIVLSRHYKLSVTGVLLPSHAFVELQADGRTIDVETTSTQGFDQKHDAAFYQRNNSAWFSDRGLQPATYADYLKRERVDPVVLGARNMLNQHTRAEQMDSDDSARLAEISAFIEPGNLMAQEKRLHFYNREIHALINDEQWTDLARLFAQTYSNVLTSSTRFAQHERLQRAVHAYLSGAMLAYAHQGDVEQTLAAFGELQARQLVQNDEQDPQAEQRVTHAISVLINNLVEQQRFEDGLLVLALTEGHLQNPEAWPSITTWFYLRWAEHYWQQSQWQDVIAVLSEYISQPHYQPQEDSKPQELIASAFYNWVLKLSENNELDAAAQVVAQCRATPAHQAACQKANKVLQQARAKEAKRRG